MQLTYKRKQSGEKILCEKYFKYCGHWIYCCEIVRSGKKVVFPLHELKLKEEYEVCN
jgi:hypothetical protein